MNFLENRAGERTLHTESRQIIFGAIQQYLNGIDITGIELGNKAGHFLKMRVRVRTVRYLT